MESRLRFPRQRRLSKRREFLLVQGQGRRTSARHYLFFVRRRAPAKGGDASSLAMPTRFGITVTRKVGNAVVRNRIKRVVREGCRLLAPSFPLGLDMVIVAKPSAISCGLSDVRGELAEWLARHGQGPGPANGHVHRHGNGNGGKRS